MIYISERFPLHLISVDAHIVIVRVVFIVTVVSVDSP